jgi:hypothetical protein
MRNGEVPVVWLAHDPREKMKDHQLPKPEELSELE